MAGLVIRLFVRLALRGGTTAVTVTGGVVNVPGVAPRLMPSAVLTAWVPFGVEPLGNWTLISRSPLLPAGSGVIITNCTRVRPVPM